jgi:hypothetical protein
MRGETFYQTRTPDPEWERRLALIAPPSECVNWLKLRWFPGHLRRTDTEPDRLVQRWVVYEIDPNPEHLDPEFRADLEHKLSPRARGSWREVRRLKEGGRDFETVKVWDTPALVTTEQWELYRETHGWATLCWIVQGSAGGHKARFTPNERRLLKMAKLPSEAPAPGNLPYLEPNELTWRLLAELDKLSRWNRGEWTNRYATKSAASLTADTEKTARRVEFRMALSRWLEEQAKAIAGDLARATKGLTLPAGDRHYNRDEDAVEHAFIHEE